MKFLAPLILTACSVKAPGIAGGLDAIAAAGEPAIALLGLTGEACATVAITSAVASVSSDIATATGDRPTATPDVVIDLGQCEIVAPKPMPCDARIAWDVTSSYLAQVPAAWDGLAAGNVLKIEGMPWPVCSDE